VIQALTDEHNVSAFRLYLFEARYSIWLQMRFEFVLKKLVSQKIEAIATDPAQYAVHHTGCENPVGGVQKRPQGGHKKNQSSANHSGGESLRIPGEESNRLNGGKVQQASLNAPVDRGGRDRNRGISSRWIQKYKKA
jgi:hypothetical protein